ncbi:hypothetical protein ACFY05_42100 [Microtetraspora fusca]|uniref:Uncharacterized protein n=1 Tax=Microtetraspora fusca TaxID=1997 RepID=A0ABW6VJ86_MICFU
MTEHDLYLVFAAVVTAGVAMFTLGALAALAYRRQGRPPRILRALLLGCFKRRARLIDEHRREIARLRAERDDAHGIVSHQQAQIGTMSNTIGHLRKLVAKRDERAVAAEHRERLALEYAEMLRAGCYGLARSWERLGPAIALPMATVELLGLLQQLGSPMAESRSGS